MTSYYVIESKHRVKLYFVQRISIFAQISIHKKEKCGTQFAPLPKVTTENEVFEEQNHVTWFDKINSSQS